MGSENKRWFIRLSPRAVFTWLVVTWRWAWCAIMGMTQPSLPLKGGEVLFPIQSTRLSQGEGKKGNLSSSQYLLARGTQVKSRFW
ncbi:hypothetical protein B0O80DRAFT_444619 [Mortierella sp. GBAus27b]|nr:hypothetical protein B0O80DRAFT_444619 [Mortierella sp. GBAus27b]